MKKPDTGTQLLIRRLEIWVQWAVEMGSTDLAALLSEVIVQFKGRDKWFAACHECGRLHSPLRRPARSRRNYCDICRAAGIPLRDASRAHRARKRAVSHHENHH